MGKILIKRDSDNDRRYVTIVHLPEFPAHWTTCGDVVVEHSTQTQYSLPKTKYNKNIHAPNFLGFAGKFVLSSLLDENYEYIFFEVNGK